MLYLTFITVGEIPRGPFREIRDEFVKRLGPYVKLTHRIVEDESNIENQIPVGDLTVVLDERGRLMTSVEAAELFRRFENEGRHVTVILGGPKGFSKEFKAHANISLSLSPMTTTHDLAHIFFLEQLFRIATINHGKEYHY